MDRGQRNGYIVREGPVDHISTESIRGFAVRRLECAEENREVVTARPNDHMTAWKCTLLL